MKHDYQERKQNRITRALELARKKEQESDQLYDHANKMASVIPMGQPILVGHHSEKEIAGFAAESTTLSVKPSNPLNRRNTTGKRRRS
ncbi:DUF3560 domain-containing protein [Chitinophaga pollutisoli]|uniref:DUF3560 domain-containing protein n=1 Tax=Chitinophaga pollutisoli TaxID=3133966 RepID=A0ABZ2YLS6_9BACT